MIELEYLNGVVRILSYLSLFVTMAIWIVEARKVFRLGSALLVIFLVALSVYITNGVFYAIFSVFIMLLIPVIAAISVQMVSFILLNRIEKKYGNSGIKLSLKPFDIYKNIF